MLEVFRGFQEVAGFRVRGLVVPSSASGDFPFVCGSSVDSKQTGMLFGRSLDGAALRRSEGSSTKRNRGCSRWAALEGDGP